ncbi:hypothetical protein [Limoniibacter endophyticus]|uniref:Uncharacterized protein n=1 Tax=Limoniibacter endophyticus TaxID=1565040 RepID=A0A8J3DL96_9HYPH|nr:hypothetical protein [Limoniibacter endophyticus]GHC79607.1 hypothetical protein GCM10010136_32310 [Limoniibacter endophyticus]
MTEPRNRLCRPTPPTVFLTDSQIIVLGISLLIAIAAATALFLWVAWEFLS